MSELAMEETGNAFVMGGITQRSLTVTQRQLAGSNQLTIVTAQRRDVKRVD